MSALVLIYFAVLFFACAAGAYKFNAFDKPLKLFCLLVLTTFISEVIALKAKEILGTKAPVHHFYNIIELSCISVYFAYTAFEKRSRWLIILLIFFSVGIGVGNLYFFQPLMKANTNMLIAECILIIGMSLFSLFVCLKKEDGNSFGPHFHIWMAMLILWSGSFFFWAFLSYLKQMHSDYYLWISPLQTFINIIVYGWIGIVFLSINKKTLACN